MSDPRWTLVTGASSGIGAALARAFASEGDALVLTARRRERLDALAAELAAAHGIRTLVIAEDLADPEAPARLMRAVEAEGIALHTLVNNAGFGLRGAFAALPLERQLEMVRLNVGALTHLTGLALPGMLARGEGGVVNLASVASFMAGPGMAVYFATKAFVLSLSEALHEEARGRGVTVTAVCPGPVRTEFAGIADLDGSRAFRAGAIDAEQVAREALAGYRAGRAVVLPGVAKVAPLGARLLPRGVLRRLTGAMQRGDGPGR